MQVKVDVTYTDGHSRPITETVPVEVGTVDELWRQVTANNPKGFSPHRVVTRETQITLWDSASGFHKGDVRRIFG